MSGSDEKLKTILEATTRGDRQAGAALLPLVYDELRRLARSRIAQLPPGNTLQPTALVHEAYMRVVGDVDPGWTVGGTSSPPLLNRCARFWWIKPEEKKD